MGYVMVPVPEEHVEEAMALILRIAARARQVPWDQDAMSELFHEADEPTKSVLSAVSRSASAGSAPVDHELADSVELHQREVLGIVRELNEAAAAQSRLPIIIVRMETVTLPNGRTREQRILDMNPEVTPLVREAERAELAANPHPLLGDQA
jgi:hypothetical protein